MAARLRHGTSLWLDARSPTAVRAPALHGNHETDVVIVGGGITGCIAAYRLASAGVRVVLIDAARIGRGSTAASTALLMQEPDADFGRLAARYGTSGARAIWQMSRQAVRALIRTLARLPGAPDVQRRPSLYVTRRADQVRELRQELTARHRAGLAGDWLTPERVQRLAGIDGAGGILTRGNAQVDPYRACLAFARAAQHAGASLHEHTRARIIRSHASGIDVDTGRARIAAATIVVATGYATPDFRPLAGRFRLSDTYVVGTAPLAHARRQAIGLADVMLWDTERPYHYARWTASHRLLFGGHDRPHTRKTTAATIACRVATLVAELHEWYPAARDARVEYAWEGLFATTPDGLPYIGPHRRYPRHLFALGYGGNGMTFAFLAAQIITRMIQGTSQPADQLFRFGRLR
jgi:glycine/D-amino acid oxidase-like deaminating enzyme